MGTERLKQHICDTVKEWQLKIGNGEAAMRLYYPKNSLINLLGLSPDAGEQDLSWALAAFCHEEEPRLGKIIFSHQGERYCIEIPKEGCAYIDKEIPEPEFLKAFLSVLMKKGSDLEQIRLCFQEFGKKHGLEYQEEDKKSEGVVFYFKEQAIEPYIYCVEQGDFGLTYHRFTREDYKELFIS